MLTELYKYKGYIWFNAVAELRFRYAGSVIGVLWNVLNPLFQIIVYTFVFSSIMRTRLPGQVSTTAFAIYLCAGLLGWISFSEGLSRGTSAYVENAVFLKKLPIPEHVFVAQAIVSSTLNAGVSYGLLIISMLLLHAGLSATALLVPVILVLFMSFAFGLALILATINVFVRDTAQILTIIMMVWMWLTPIVYVQGILPEAFMKVVEYNAAFPFISALHVIIVYHNLPTIVDWTLMVLLATGVPVFGYVVLSALRKEIRDVI